MRVLMVAPTCDGTDVGEAWVAHQWADRLSGRHELTLVTYRKRGAVGAREQIRGARVVEWEEPRLIGRQERLNSLLKPAYFPFAARALVWIRAAVIGGDRFDVAFQPTPVAMRYPSPLAGTTIPYVIGPLGGSLSDPPGFPDDETSPGYVQLRRFDGARLRHDPFLRATYSRAACVLGIAPYVAEHLDGVPLRRFEVMSETGLPAIPDPVDRSGRQDPVRILFVGRLVRSKGVRDLIEALDRVRELPVSADIVGDGFDRSACEDLVRRLDLTTRITFRGRLPKPEVDVAYHNADIFVFPSYREPGGNVPWEAMGHGLPLVVADRGGPSAIVSDDCGFRIPPTEPKAYVAGIAEAIRILVNSQELRASMGAAGRRRVLEVGLWPQKIEALERILSRVATCRD